MGIINAAQNIGMKKPIIIRLKGTNVEEAKKLIEVPSSLLYHLMFVIILHHYRTIYACFVVRRLLDSDLSLPMI